MIYLVKSIQEHQQNKPCSFVKLPIIVFLIIIFSLSCISLPEEKEDSSTTTTTTTTTPSVRPPHGTIKFVRNTTNYLYLQYTCSYKLIDNKWKKYSIPYPLSCGSQNYTYTDVSIIEYYSKKTCAGAELVIKNGLETVSYQGETRTVYY